MFLYNVCHGKNNVFIACNGSRNTNWIKIKNKFAIQLSTRFMLYSMK